MNIKKVIKLIVVAMSAAIMFSGCVNSQYQSDENVKKSIVILIQKVERLESLHGIKSRKTQYGHSSRTPILVHSGSMNRTLKRDISVFTKRNLKSKKIVTIKAGEVVKISACDKYGWCILKNQKGFIQKWKVIN